MTIWEAIALGIVQGITEFLPISSSGHLIAMREFFGIEQSSMIFDVGLHVATLGAIIWALRNDIKMLLTIGSEKLKNKLAVKILVATIPVVIFGFIVSKTFINDIRSSSVVAVSLIFWGIILIFADIYSRKFKKSTDDVHKMTWKQTLFIGVAQVLALIPGTSRSGVTITAGLLTKVNRVNAAKFSFLLGVPAIAGAGLLTGIDVVEHGIDISYTVLIVGMVSAFISGVVAISFLLKFLQKGNFIWLGAYRIVLGIVLISFVLWF